MEGKPVEVNILSFCFDDKAAALKVSIPEELKNIVKFINYTVIIIPRKILYLIKFFILLMLLVLVLNQYIQMKCSEIKAELRLIELYCTRYNWKIL